MTFGIMGLVETSTHKGVSESDVEDVKDGVDLIRVRIEPMDREGAVAITHWAYDPPYDFYNMDVSEESLRELLDGTYFKMLEGHSLMGYFCCGNAAQVPIGRQYGAYPENGSLDIGLGMNPILTGHGRGYAFVTTVLAYAQSQLEATSFRLTVATFNERAMALYKKLGFTPIMFFSRDNIQFVTMEWPGR